MPRDSPNGRSSCSGVRTTRSLRSSPTRRWPSREQCAATSMARTEAWPWGEPRKTRWIDQLDMLASVLPVTWGPLPRCCSSGRGDRSPRKRSTCAAPGPFRPGGGGGWSPGGRALVTRADGISTARARRAVRARESVVRLATVRWFAAVARRRSRGGAEWLDHGPPRGGPAGAVAERARCDFDEAVSPDARRRSTRHRPTHC